MKNKTLADKFAEFLKSLDNLAAPYIDDDKEEIIVDGHIPKDKLEEFLRKFIDNEFGRQGYHDVDEFYRD